MQRQWSDGSLNVVVATIAFGMGIDRADVRWVEGEEGGGLGRGVVVCTGVGEALGIDRQPLGPGACMCMWKGLCPLGSGR